MRFQMFNVRTHLRRTENCMCFQRKYTHTTQSLQFKVNSYFEKMTNPFFEKVGLCHNDVTK